MSIEGFTCNLKPKLVEEWVQQKEADGHCPVCLLKPLASYYLGTLADAKATKQQADLQKAWDTSNVLTIAKALDRIKAEVGEPLKKDLLELDCFAQSFRESEE